MKRRSGIFAHRIFAANGVYARPWQTRKIKKLTAMGFMKRAQINVLKIIDDWERKELG